MSILSSTLARAGALAIVVSSVGGAQQTWSPFVSLGSGSSAGPLSPASTASFLVVEPGALVESSRGSILARWSAPIGVSAFQITDADLAMRARLLSRGRIESSILATARYDHVSLGRIAGANSVARLQVGTTAGTHGLQFGAGVDGWRSSINGNNVVVPATTISGWIRRFGLAVSAEVSARALPGNARANGDTARYSMTANKVSLRGLTTQTDTAIITGNPFVPAPTPQPQPQATTPQSEAHAFGEAALRVSGILMSFGVDGHAGLGMATGGRARGFGSLILTRWVSPGLALTGGVVVQPPEPGSSSRRAGALFGIRLASAPRVFPHFVNAPKVGAAACSVRLVHGAATIEIRAPAAAHVELSGDFTRWRPITFDHIGGERWTLTARLTPGIHRFVVRVDGGAWLPAPGLPQTADPYEGTVSVIVAP